MATAPLIPRQIEVVFQAIFTEIGLALTQPTPGNVFSSVRIGWQTEGQPAEKITDNVVYLRVVEVDDLYNRTRDEKLDVNNNKVVTYIRVWQLFIRTCGPNSFDNMRIIKSKLLDDQQTHDYLAGANLYLVTDTEAPRRLVLPFPGGQWQETVDWEARFNERVKESTPVSTVLSTEVIVETKNRIIDITVKPPQFPAGTYGAKLGGK